MNFLILAKDKLYSESFPFLRDILFRDKKNFRILAAHNRMLKGTYNGYFALPDENKTRSFYERLY